LGRVEVRLGEIVEAMARFRKTVEVGREKYGDAIKLFEMYNFGKFWYLVKEYGKIVWMDRYAHFLKVVEFMQWFDKSRYPWASWDDFVEYIPFMAREAKKMQPEKAFNKEPISLGLYFEGVKRGVFELFYKMRFGYRGDRVKDFFLAFEEELRTMTGKQLIEALRKEGLWGKERIVKEIERRRKVVSEDLKRR